MSGWQKDAKRRTGQLLQELEVGRVILIDDEAYNVTEALVRRSEIPRLGQSQWDGKGSYDTFFSASWPALDVQERRQAQDRAVRKHPDWATDPIDIMRILFDSAKWVAVDPAGWQECNDSLLSPQGANGTLVFFDLNLGNEGGPLGGAQLLSQYLKENPDARAVLLTANIGAEDELDVPQDVVEAVSRPASDIIVASKDHLTQERCTEFADLVRTSLTLPNLMMIRDKVRAALKGAVGEALHRFDELPLRVVEDIVVRASRVEGVWEVDTYTRVFEILLRQDLYAKVSSHHNQELRDAIAAARRVARIPHGDHAPSKREVGILMAAENFFSGGVINEAGLPLANGDIFEIAGDLYVLAMQPCDLAYRDDGTGTREEIELATLLAARWTEEGPRDREEELPHGLAAAADLVSALERPGKPLVSLRPARYLALELLDLCSFDSRGRATLHLDRPPPSSQVPGQNDRYESLREKVVKSRNSRQRSHGAGRLFINTRGDVPVSRRWQSGGRSLSFDVRRIARLAPGYSAQLLTAFSHDISRAAYAPALDRFLDRPTVPQ